MSLHPTYSSLNLFYFVVSTHGVMNAQWLLCANQRCLVHLSRSKANVDMFAPDENQMHVINHLTGSPAEGQSRYISVSLCLLSVLP